MSHNITPMGEVDTLRTTASSLALNGETQPETDAAPNVAQYPVFTVQDGDGNQASFYLRGPEAPSPAGLVLNPWTPEKVAIVGEDLYALRAFLNELPEEAFVEPAPAAEVAEQAWTPGDVCLFAADDYWATYTRLHDGTWQRISGTLGVDRATDYTDTVIEKKLADQTDRFSVLRKQVTA